jgi:predicted esterase
LLKNCNFQREFEKNGRWMGLIWALFLAWKCAAAWAEDSAAAGWSEVEFERGAPYGSSTELMRHLGHRLAVPEYDLHQEKFRVFLPDCYSTNGDWGLLVWISPSDEPRVPASWEAELIKHQLLLISARKAGNSRHAIQRCQLALDAVCNMCQRYRLNPKRLYIAGFSGGGRIASIMGVAYADLFSGTVSICGADFFQGVPSPSGGFYPPTYKPDPGVLLRAKRYSRFVIITGEKDMNRDNAKSTAELGFRRSGFKHTEYLEVPGMGHTLPPALVLGRALQFLSSAD